MPFQYACAFSAFSHFFAACVETFVFLNETNEELEGELIFPLQEGFRFVCASSQPHSSRLFFSHTRAGHTVVAYAVDVNGRLVDAVVCEKDKARAVFEAEV